jgi:hypothetical protein
MILTDKTLAILKNFSVINQNIVFKPGNIIKTMNTGKNIIAWAEVDFEFDREVPIYDVKKLISALQLFKSADVTFDEKSLIISSDRGQFEYFYSDPEVVFSAMDKRINHQEIFTIDITKEMIQTLNSGVAISGATVISFRSENGNAVLFAENPEESTSTKFKSVIGPTDLEFDARILAERLILIPDDYTLTYGKTESGKATLLYFINSSKTLEYWISCEK